MMGIAFSFGDAAVDRLHDHPAACRTLTARRRVVAPHAWRHIVGRHEVRNQLVTRRRRAAFEKRRRPGDADRFEKLPPFDHARLSVVADDAVVGSSAIAMTLHAPAHRQVGDPPNAMHRTDVAVTGVARNLREAVRFVIEADEGRELVDLHPGNRLARVPEAPQLENFRMAGRDVFVTADATFERRDAGKSRTPRGAVTDRTVELVVADMDAVTEVDRLFRRVRRLRGGR